MDFLPSPSEKISHAQEKQQKNKRQLSEPYLLPAQEDSSESSSSGDEINDNNDDTNNNDQHQHKKKCIDERTANNVNINEPEYSQEDSAAFSESSTAEEDVGEAGGTFDDPSGSFSDEPILDDEEMCIGRAIENALELLAIDYLRPAFEEDNDGTFTSHDVFIYNTSMERLSDLKDQIILGTMEFMGCLGLSNEILNLLHGADILSFHADFIGTDTFCAVTKKLCRRSRLYSLVCTRLEDATRPCLWPDQTAREVTVTIAVEARAFVQAFFLLTHLTQVLGCMIKYWIKSGPAVQGEQREASMRRAVREGGRSIVAAVLRGYGLETIQLRGKKMMAQIMLNLGWLPEKKIY